MRICMSIALVLLLAGFALAAESGHSHTMTPEIGSQHSTMSVMQKQWAVCKKYLDTGDFAAAGVSLELMQKAAGDLEKFKLHKNSEMTEKFKERADNFKKNLSELEKAIKDKDKMRVQSLSAAIDNAYRQCHSVFR